MAAAACVATVSHVTVLSMPSTRTILSGLAFGEGPRWHENRLWFSDMHDHRVVAVDLDGKSETIVEVPERPSGLGWLPDGRLLVVSMVDRRLLRLDGDSLVEVADLSRHAPWHCNDMVVDALGRAYVGNFGSDIDTGAPPTGTVLLLVTPSGDVREVASDLLFPNGMVITPDEKTLIVAETFAARLTAFDIAADGSLSNRREWAKLEGAVPDGICLDAEGAIWVASPVSAEALRVREGGEVTHRVPVETQAYACMLGGPQRRHLFVCTAKSPVREECRAEHGGKIEVTLVDVPGAGRP